MVTQCRSPNFPAHLPSVAPKSPSGHRAFLPHRESRALSKSTHSLPLLPSRPSSAICLQPEDFPEKMANIGATEEEVFMTRSELLDELNLQQGMLSSLEADTEDYDLSKSVLEQEISRLKAQLRALKQKKQQQNANVTLRGPFLAAACSSNKPARNPASSSATPTSSNPTSFGNPSASKYKSSDPFAGKQPFLYDSLTPLPFLVSSTLSTCLLTFRLPSFFRSLQPTVTILHSDLGSIRCSVQLHSALD